MGVSSGFRQVNLRVVGSSTVNEVKQKMFIEKVMMKRKMGLKVLFAVTLLLGLYVNFG